MNKQEFIDLMKITFTRWQKHDPTLTAGALTFFTIMPLPSLALIAVAILAQVYGQHHALPQLITQLNAFAVANLFVQLLNNAGSPLTSFFGSLISFGFDFRGGRCVFDFAESDGCNLAIV